MHSVRGLLRRGTSSLHANLLKEGCRGKFADHKTNVPAAGGSAGGEGSRKRALRQPCLGGEAIGIVCSGGLNSAHAFYQCVEYSTWDMGGHERVA